MHVIFNHNGKNLLTKKEIRCKDDVFTHLYTLIVNPDGTYEVLIDNEKAESGTLEEDWDFLPPKEIKDPEAKKPEDWDDREKIDDPEDTKPEDWEKPEHIADPDATKVLNTDLKLVLSHINSVFDLNIPKEDAHWFEVVRAIHTMQTPQKQDKSLSENLSFTKC